MGREPQIVVVGTGEIARVELLGQLTKAGFSRVVSGESIVLAEEHLGLPDVLVAVGADVRSICEQAREVPPLAQVPLLAVVPGVPASEATAVLAAGADDVIRQPYLVGVLAARVRNMARFGRARSSNSELGKLQAAVIEIQNLLAAGSGTEGLRDALNVARRALHFDRASIVAHVAPSTRAYVIAATDDPTLSKFTLQIDDYPEIQEALRRGEPLLIQNVLDDPVMASVSAELEDKPVRGAAVFPVTGRTALGVVLFRREKLGLSRLANGDVQTLAFGELFAKQIAAQLVHSHVIQSLEDQTGRISRARYEAERRLRMIDSLKEHFEAAADGVAVLDEDGRILFVNKAAEQITGFARDGLLGSPLLDMVPSLQVDVLQEVIRSVLAGTNLEAFDLELTTTAGGRICVSVTTSTVLSASKAVILSFRDVTAQRALEVELRKTKEFLESLIDSTVDAIIAADVNGTVILFNQGAERIYGFSAEDVVGVMPVWQLYPEGVATQVMRMLRSVSYGGVGRLEQTRREVINKQGEMVPVNMTASIIYESYENGGEVGAREVATVGIFSDLRDRIRIEQRLLQAQQKLQNREQQALVAELAGAAAHELNQPLTSIIGYAQLIQRQSEHEAKHLRAVDIIMREAERMADIVKKIGRITRFETKEYVGEATILDLDKSAAASSPELVIPDPMTANAGALVPSDSSEDDAPTGPAVRRILNGGDTGGHENAHTDDDEDAATTESSRSSSDSRERVDEPTVVGHRARIFELHETVCEGEETLEEIDLEEAMDFEDALEFSRPRSTVRTKSGAVDESSAQLDDASEDVS